MEKKFLKLGENFPETPMTDKVFADSVYKKKVIAKNVKEIMEVLGLDLTDDSLVDTPNRVAKMYVDEIFKGLIPDNFPKITTVKNKFDSQMVLESDITLNSSCEHHLVTIIGNVHIAYIPKDKVIGLSKMNRLVDYFGARPQVQERLTEQIQKAMCHLLGIQDVAVVVDGAHMCVRTRGIKDRTSITRTSALGGKFKDCPTLRAEFMNSIPNLADFKAR